MLSQQGVSLCMLRECHCILPGGVAALRGSHALRQPGANADGRPHAQAQRHLPQLHGRSAGLLAGPAGTITESGEPLVENGSDAWRLDDQRQEIVFCSSSSSFFCFSSSFSPSALPPSDTPSSEAPWYNRNSWLGLKHQVTYSWFYSCFSPAPPPALVFCFN